MFPQLLQFLGKPLLFTLCSGEGVGISLFSCAGGSDAFGGGSGGGWRWPVPPAWGCPCSGQVLAALHLPTCILLLCVPGWRSFVPGFDVLIPQSCLLRLRSAAAASHVSRSARLHPRLGKGTLLSLKLGSRELLAAVNAWEQSWPAWSIAGTFTGTASG